LAALNDKLTSAGWTSKPRWQIRPLLDPVIPVAFPDVVVDVIKQAARAATQ